MSITTAQAIGPAILAAIQEGHSAFMLVRSGDRWQCSMKRRDGNSYHVIVDRDPIMAAYRCIVPFKLQDHTSQPLPAAPEVDPRRYDLFRPYDPSEATDTIPFV